MAHKKKNKKNNRIKISAFDAERLIKQHTKYYTDDGISKDKAEKMAIEELKLDFKW